MKTSIPYLKHMHEPRWHHERSVTGFLFPAQMRWLLNPNSMTQQLRAASSELRVNVLQQGWSSLSRSEANILHAKSSRSYALIREVELYCDNVLWMYGRTVIPKLTLTGKERRLRYLRNKPIGDYLFADPTVERSEFEIAKITSNNEKLWARRSLFYLSGKPLLLTEIFLPTMIDYFVTHKGFSF